MPEIGVNVSKSEETTTYTFDIDLETLEISNIRPRFETDMCGFSMEDFHRGMPDLEYDRDVPTDFGKE